MYLFISHKITKNWKRFARNLEVDDEAIDQIEDTENLFKERVIAVMHYVNTKKGDLKWNKTKNALKEIGLDFVILELYEKYLQADKHPLHCGGETRI